MPGTKARVARASRIFVEGRHDAELVEKVWGDDLRVEGVVVEYIEGVDDLAEHLRADEVLVALSVAGPATARRPSSAESVRYHRQSSSNACS